MGHLCSREIVGNLMDQEMDLYLNKTMILPIWDAQLCIVLVHQHSTTVRPELKVSSRLVMVYVTSSGGSSKSFFYTLDCKLVEKTITETPGEKTQEMLPVWGHLLP